MKRIFPPLLFTILAAVFLAVGSSSWLLREVVVSVGLRSRDPVPCQLFFTERPGAEFASEQSVTVFANPGGSQVRVSLPVRRLVGLRVDFGTAPGTVRAGPVTVAGRTTRALDWRDFGIRHDIGRFDVDAKGAVDVESVGGDPYAVHPDSIGVPCRVRVNYFSAFCLLLLAFAFWWPLAGPGGLLRNASPQDGEPVCSRSFATLAGMLVLARLAVSARLPPGFSRSPWDDLWFLNAADGMFHGQWMGPFDQHTLIKGCFGPMVLAFSSFCGIPYLFAETLLYVLSCLFFVGACSRISRNRLFLAAATALLLFNPLSLSMDAFQRIYRNGMSLWQVPLVFGCLFLLLTDSRKPWRTVLLRGLAAGVAIWMFQNTREDGIWLWPVALPCLVLAAYRSWRAGDTRAARAARAALCLAPILVLLLGNVAVCLVNWRVYGRPLRNDRDAGNYAKAMQDLYLIEPDPEDDARLSAPEHAGHYHSISWSVICKAFDASPTLQTARRGIEDSFDTWARGGGYHGRDLYEDKPLFGIRHGAAVAGYYSSLSTSEEFWASVHAELSAAFKDGRLGKRGLSLTAMCAPFRAKQIRRILLEWAGAMSDAACFRDTKAKPGRTEPWWGKMEWSGRLHSLPGDRFFTADTVRTERRYIDRANRIGALYSAAMPFVLAVALLLFAVATVRIKEARAAGDSATTAWLFSLGILGGFLLHTACIAYVSATTFWARIGSYMAASYQLELMFAVVVAGLTVARAESKGGGSRPGCLRDELRRKKG